jgi:hypothetical protein
MPCIHMRLISPICVPSDPTLNIWRPDVDKSNNFFFDVKLQRWRPEHDAPVIRDDDADRPDDPDLAGHHHP